MMATFCEVKCLLIIYVREHCYHGWVAKQKMHESQNIALDLCTDATIHNVLITVTPHFFCMYMITPLPGNVILVVLIVYTNAHLLSVAIIGESM